MTPRFSLTLSHEGIGLLHRTKTGWSEVGQVALDDPHLNEALRMLRATASALEGGGVLSQLVLPESQILYTRLTPEGPLNDDAIRAALDGLTPYPVEELVFDWEADGESAQVAAVARETLAEAEVFAVQHRFNPLCFTAWPKPEEFPRAPRFGTTGVAASLLAKGETPRPAPRGETPAPETAPQTKAEDAAPAPEVGAEPGIPETAAEPAPDTVTEPPEEAPAAEEKPTPEKAIIAPLPAPEDRPAFATRRDSAAASAPAGAPHAPSVEARLTLAPGSPTAAPDIAGGKIGVTAAEAPEIKGSSGRAKGGTAKKPRGKAARKPAKAPASKTETSKPSAAKAPSPVTTPVAPPPPKAPAAGEGTDLPGLFAPEPSSSGLPKLGLALTGVLLVILLLVALWALFLRGPEEPTEEAAAAPAVAEETAQAPPMPAEEPAAPPAVMEELPEQAPATRADPPPSETAGTAESAPSETAAPQQLSPEELQTLYAATGIYATAPERPEAPAQDRVDDVYIASLDPRVAAHDAVALPAAPEENHDVRPATPANPPGPGDLFKLDDRGLVRPSPEGTPNPEGVTVFSGPPRITPPERPETDIAVDPAEAAEAARLAEIRPRLRPDDLAETNERANLGGLTRAELATRRPLARPPSLQEQALAEAEAEAQADGAEGMGASTLAVASSPNPLARPGDFAAVVEKARKETQRAAVVPAAAAAPRIPSSASVAKQATLPNAINLRQVNLIGIYGSASNRRALVRLKSGRYVKVQVGDRLDGGRVTAIGESELHYAKRGRDEVLKLPEG